MTALKNNLTKNVSEIVLPKFLESFASNIVLSKTVDRQILQGKFDDAKAGDHVQVKRPHQFKTENTTDGDMTGKSPSPLISGTATARVQNFITTWVSWTQLEAATSLNQINEILKPAAEAMATELENRLGLFMLHNGALSLGTAGTPLTTWEEVARAGAFMQDLGITGTRYAAINPWASVKLAGAQTQLAEPGSVKTAWHKAVIPRNFAGIENVLSANSLQSRTIGNFGGTLTVSSAPVVDYDSVKNTYQFFVQLTGATASVTGFLKAGDQLTFTATHWVNHANKQVLINDAGNAVSFTATVTVDANSDSSGKVGVTLSGVPIFDANVPQYNTVDRLLAAGDAVTISGTKNKVVKPSLFYSKDFCGLTCLQLPKLHSIESQIVNWEGFSIRAHKYSDGTANKNMVRFDLLPAFGCYNPHKGGQLNGGL